MVSRNLFGELLDAKILEALKDYKPVLPLNPKSLSYYASEMKSRSSSMYSKVS